MTVYKLGPDAEQAVIDLRRKHSRTWRDKSLWFWLMSMLEEFIELALTLAGLHPGPAEWEVAQIGAICINLIEVLRERHVS